VAELSWRVTRGLNGLRNRCICIYIHVCIYIYIYIHEYICHSWKATRGHSGLGNRCICIYISTHLCIFLFIYMCIYVSVHVCDHIRTSILKSRIALRTSRTYDVRTSMERTMFVHLWNVRCSYIYGTYDDTYIYETYDDRAQWFSPIEEVM
jgi:hypothetical protein